MTKRIAFIRPRAIPFANVIVPKILAENFSNYKIDVIDIQALVKNRPDIIATNTLLSISMYGQDIILGYKQFKNAFWRTPYIFSIVKTLVSKQLARNDYLFTFQMQSLFDCSIPGVPHFIYTDHTHLANLTYQDHEKRNLYPQKWIDLEKQIYRNSTLTFLWSSHIKQSLIEQYHYPEEKAVLAYVGSNIEPTGTQTGDKSYENQNILFVGMDWERKGGPELIAAFKLVLDRHPYASLTIVGANPKLNLPSVQVLGKIPLQELEQHYKAATIFCMPTHIEPFGVVFLEAMQARLPIVGTRVGAIPDLLQDGWNGWLVEPGDVNGIAEALMKLLVDPDLCRKFGERNILLTQERYSWKAVGKKLHNHILEALANGT